MLEHRPRFLPLPLLTLFVLLAGATASGARSRDAEKKPGEPPSTEWADKLLGSLEWRLVGPFRGGRSAAVAGVVGQREVYYFGSTGGGVWKSEDGGASWKSVSDGFFGGSIGAVAVSEWDPNVLYVGGGEKTVRGNVSHGDGVWKSTDAGKSWQHKGLAGSRHVPRIVIHPKSPELAYAAVLGHLYGPNEERGVYRTRDGGASWERIHFVRADAGCIELVMDPSNPRILYAGFWRVRRTPWSLESGGEGSGLWKTTDGGESWKELTRNPGLPQGTVGIFGVTVSAADPQSVYAIVEAEDGGVFRSRDGGASWQKTNDDRALRQRAWYYSRIYADPADPETVYVLNVDFHRSKDGGKSFETIETPHGDNHDLWIDPHDPRRMIEANDGGANVTLDGGATWTPQTNQPTAQFYRVSTDDVFPYRIYGAQQDNTTVRIVHRAGGSGAEPAWEPTAGGESGHVVAHPGKPEVVFGGSYGGYLTRMDHETGENRLVDVWPDNPMGWGAAELEYRFQWNFPLFFSPHPPHALYAAANVLFRSTDEGHGWQAISPDLTRNDKSKQGSSGGPITKDNTSVEYYGTIFAALESPHEPGVLWAGSDDGLVHLTRDEGASWKNVTPPALPEWSMINSLEAHPFEKGGLYLAATRYKWDDMTPLLFATTDYGATWRRIDGGIPRDQFTRVVRADPERRGLLYAGTERGVFVSFDDGRSWRSLQRNLPVVPITDLAVKDGDLIAATQGRSFWSLDDLSPLRQLEPEVAEKELEVLVPREVWRGFGEAVVHYWLGETKDLKEKPARVVKIEFLDGAGKVLRSFSSEKKEEKKGKEKKTGDKKKDPEVATAPGMHRLVWDLRLEEAERFEELVLWSEDGLAGPMVPPGRYGVRLTVEAQHGEQHTEAFFAVKADPRLATTPEGYAEQFAFLVGLHDKLSETHKAIGKIRGLRGQLAGLGERLGGAERFASLKTRAEEISGRLLAIEEALYQTKNRSPQDPLNFPVRFNDKLASLAASAASAQAPPTLSMLAVRDRLVGAIDAELAKLRAIEATELPELNRLALELEVPALGLGGS